MSVKLFFNDVELNERQFNILKEDLNLDQLAGNTFVFDLGYLANKIVGHEHEVDCEGYFDVIDEGENKVIRGLDVHFSFIETDKEISDDEYREIFERTAENINTYTKY